MIFLAGIGVLGIGVAVVILMVAPDHSKGAFIMLMVSGVVLAPILTWQMYLGTLVPHDLEAEFAVVPDIKGRASHPADPDLEAERAFLDSAVDDPVWLS